MFIFPPFLQAGRSLVCNLCFFIPVEAVSPPWVVQMYYLNLASADFTASAALQGICGSTLQLHALRLAYAANSTLAKSGNR